MNLREKISLPSWVLLDAGHVTVGREWVYSDVCSPFIRLYYIASGSGRIEMDGHVVNLLPGNTYIIPAFTRHSTHCDHRLEQYYLHVIESDYDRFDVTNAVSYPESLPADEFLKSVYQHIVDENPDISLPDPNPAAYDTSPTFRAKVTRALNSPIHIKIKNSSLIGMIMSQWIENRHNLSNIPFANTKMPDICSYIHDNLAEAISVDDLARIANMSKFHFMRIFKKYTGMTPISFINRSRIRKAQLLLADTDRSLKHIASAVGFEDYNYFIRVFRNSTGITPASYRHNIDLR